MPPDDIRDDIAQARRGDRPALDRVLSALQARLRAAATNRLGGPLRAKMATSDLLQTTYVDVVRSIGEFRGEDPESFVAWIMRIMENNLRDRLRFYGRQRRAPEEQLDQPLDGPDKGPTPSVEAMQVEHLAAVGKALAELPEDQRRVLQMRVFERREYDDIAAAMGRSQGALRMLLSRARATLTMRLDQLLDET
ncbi:MAG: sigma-70 family RNA polymerase sigma factor [Planctomycetes bacterium]|nr:sigma-70 family RNA polymerase sigma factor [Planctomycetota bacterium]MCB9885763.1 sigma-70 family RNA polymerase sigma factor [Planctomycetota bacterium]